MVVLADRVGRTLLIDVVDSPTVVVCWPTYSYAATCRYT